MAEDSACQTVSRAELSSQKGYAGNVILHISDLHLKELRNKLKTSERDVLQDELISKIQALAPEWQPNILCVTGDISDRNNTGGYNQARLFIQKVVSRLHIPIDNLLVCPGNHDVDTKVAQKHFFPQNAAEANTLFELPIQTTFEAIFHKYIHFCETLNLSRYTYGDYHSYLFGLKTINKINFLVCNSSWFYKGKYSIIRKACLRLKQCFTKKHYMSDKLFIGLPLLRYLQARHNLSPAQLADDTLLISLIHHPESALSNDEIHKHPTINDPPSSSFLSNLSHLVLIGDSHTLPLGKTSFCTADALCCGATLHESKTINSFCLIKLEEERILYKFYKLDPLAINNRWIADTYTSGEFVVKSKLFLIGEIMDSGYSLSSIRNLTVSKTAKSDFVKTTVSAVMPTGNTPEIASAQATEIDSSKLEVKETPAIPKPDEDAFITDVLKKISEAELFIAKLQYLEAFGIAEILAQEVVALSSLKGERVSNIYSRLGLIEGTRASWLHETEGLPLDFSLASDYLKRAKNALRS